MEKVAFITALKITSLFSYAMLIFLLPSSSFFYSVSYHPAAEVSKCSSIICPNQDIALETTIMASTSRCTGIAVQSSHIMEIILIFVN